MSDRSVKSPKSVTPAKAGVQTSSLRKQGTILKTGFLFSQETLDSCFRRNDGLVKSRKRLTTVIPAPYQVRGKLQPESSVFKALRTNWTPVFTGVTA